MKHIIQRPAPAEPLFRAAYGCAALLLALLLCFGLCQRASAAEEEALWSEEYWRAVDAVDGLSDADREELDERYLAVMKRFDCDLAALVTDSEGLEGETLSEYAAEYYEFCGFGWGEDGSGVIVVYNADTDEIAIERFGAAKLCVEDYLLDFLREHLPEYRQEYGSSGMLYLLGNCVERGLELYYGEDGERERVGAGTDRPAWYPVDPADFPKYHDRKASRVVDVADLFTEEQENALRDEIAKVSAETGKDIVIFTDVSSYGFEHKIYAADFYDFNGYGFGRDYEGVCLMICMDPQNRGWWCCCTGPDTMSLYTEMLANVIDDELYWFMAAGMYYEGVADWILNMRSLFLKGVPFPPEWLPDRDKMPEPFHDADAPRLVDEVGGLNDRETGELSARAKALSERYGVDVVLHTVNSSYDLGIRDYEELFYSCKGYGLGENYDGFLLIWLGSTEQGFVYTRGSAEGMLSGKQMKRLMDQGDTDSAYRSLNRMLRGLEHGLKTGRVPRLPVYWILMALLAALFGAIVGGIALGKAKSRMRTVARAVGAWSYLVPDSLSIFRIADIYVRTETTQKYNPPVSRSSGGGSSGGRSSYSGGYHGSSGTSHSGSGRSF